MTIMAGIANTRSAAARMKGGLYRSSIHVNDERHEKK